MNHPPQGVGASLRPRAGTRSSRYTCQTTEIAGLLPIQYDHRYLMLFKGQSQNKQSASQASDTSLYHRRLEAALLFSSSNLGHILVCFHQSGQAAASCCLPTTTFFVFCQFCLASSPSPLPNISYLGICLFVSFFLFEFKQ